MMQPKKILIVDDEPDLCEILEFNVKMAGYQATIAFSSEDALQHDPSLYDLVLLDVMMPGISGFDLAKILRQSGCKTPIIFLTAKDTEDDTLHGFDVGADDYITKPFSVREVLARVKAVLSRTSLEEDSDAIVFKGLSINPVKKSATIDGINAELTKTEFELLYLLMKNAGKVLSRPQLLSGAWPEDVVVSNHTVNVTVTRLRKKLGAYADHIVARHGYGYCFLIDN